MKALKKYLLICSIVASPFLFQSNANATDAYLEASQNACKHLRDCAKQNMGNIPPEYHQFIEQSLATMCQALPSAESIPGFGPEHNMYAPAIECMNSITTLSCKQIDDSGSSTPECEKLSNM